MLKRLLNVSFLFLLSNFYIVFFLLQSPPILNFIIIAISVLYFIIFNIMPRWKKRSFSRGEVLMGGRELIISAFLLFAADISLSIMILPKLDFNAVAIVFSELGSLLILLIIALNGIARLIFASSQLS